MDLFQYIKNRYSGNKDILVTLVVITFNLTVVSGKPFYYVDTF